MKERNNFFRVAACCPKVNPADVEGNIESIKSLLEEVALHKTDLAVFPELCVTGYTCADLFDSSVVIDNSLKALERLKEISAATHTAFIVGVPLAKNGTLYNCAVLFHHGDIITVNGKKNIPNYGEFYERRWFEPWNEHAEIAVLGDVKIGVEICEDLWIPCSPSENLSMSGAEIIVNLSASNDTIGKYEYLTTLLKAQSGKNIGAYVYAGAGFGESSTDLVFDGKTIICDNGHIIEKNRRWNLQPFYSIADIDVEALRHDRRMSGYFNKTDENVKTVASGSHLPERDALDIVRAISPTPFVPADKEKRDERCAEIINIQSAGLQRRLDFTHCNNVIIGISGGLDSTLSLLIACHAFDRLEIPRKGIYGVTMPGFGTTRRTKTNAEKLCRELGVSVMKIPINNSVKQHFADIGHDQEVKDVTYENAQARMRTLILMDLANKTGGMVLGTGDMSELALGWATYNGDHMSMYNVNGGVPKTLVRYLVEWFRDSSTVSNAAKKILTDIIDTPISPELLPPNSDDSIAQCTEDVVGPYELHDFYLYYMLRYGFGPEKIYNLAVIAFKDIYDKKTIVKWMKVFFTRFFKQQFKRSCLPDGPKIGSVCLSPRGDWRMPSDASAALWLTAVDKLQ